MKRKRARKIILISILAFFVIGGLYKLSVEPSDYNKAISKQVKVANELLEKAKLGNDKGDYSNNTIIKMKNSIAEAESLIEEEAPDIDEQREQYKKIKKDIKKFKSSSNKNCLSNEKVEELKKENKLFSKEINLGDNKKVEWNILGGNIKKIESINLDIETDTVYEEFIKEVAKDNKMKVFILSFRHNNKLPLEAKVKLHNSSKEGKYLYKYNEVSNHLIYKSEIQFKDEAATFSIDEGGDWIISNVKIEVAKLHVNEVKPGNEHKDEPSKDRKEVTEDKDEASKDKDEVSKDENNKSNTPDIAKDKKNTGKNAVDDNKNRANSDKESTNKGNTTNSKSNVGKSQNNSTKSGETKEKYCTIEIRCNTLLDNIDRLPKGKASYVPRDGVILPPTKVKIKDKENVFDVLKRVTRSKGIQMEFRNDPLYSGAYVEGINHLYEFDGGELSGWMYKVNGWFPNYGCSRYFVKENDYISWNYTCDLGKDVGDQDYYKYNNK